VLPAPRRHVGRTIRRSLYFGISSVFLTAMIAGIIWHNVTDERHRVPWLLGVGVIYIGIAGVLVSFGLGLWWAWTSSPINELLYRRERYFWISWVFLFVMIAGWVIFSLAPRSNSWLRDLMGAVIGVSAAGALFMFGLGVWWGRARGLFLHASSFRAGGDR